MKKLAVNHDKEHLCMACGLSVFRDKSDLFEMFAHMKKGSKGTNKIFKSIICLQVKKENGVLSDTSSKNSGYKHFTFWPNNAFEPLKVSCLDKVL